MANLLKNKNFPWVLRAAGAKPDAVFAIAGGGSLAAEAERLGLADLPMCCIWGMSATVQPRR